MGVLVKICGITSADAADAAVRAGADFVGLNFHPASPRHLKLDAARALAERLRGRVRLVAVLTDATDETIAGTIATTAPDFLQLHGRETPARVAEIRAKFAKPVIRAMAIADASDFASVAAYEQSADMIMYDAKAPAGASYPGGHGAAFDWQLLRGRSFARPWLLAGGLSSENVARAIRSAGAPGVDVSSGVETAPGIKSPEKIAAFVAQARAAQYSKTEERA